LTRLLGTRAATPKAATISLASLRSLFKSATDNGSPSLARRSLRTRHPFPPAKRFDIRPASNTVTEHSLNDVLTPGNAHQPNGALEVDTTAGNAGDIGIEAKIRILINHNGACESLDTSPVKVVTSPKMIKRDPAVLFASRTKQINNPELSRTKNGLDEWVQTVFSLQRADRRKLQVLLDALKQLDDDESPPPMRTETAPKDLMKSKEPHGLDLGFFDQDQASQNAQYIEHMQHERQRFQQHMEHSRRQMGSSTEDSGYASGLGTTRRQMGSSTEDSGYAGERETTKEDQMIESPVRSLSENGDRKLLDIPEKESLTSTPQLSSVADAHNHLKTEEAIALSKPSPQIGASKLDALASPFVELSANTLTCKPRNVGSERYVVCGSEQVQSPSLIHKRNAQSWRDFVAPPKQRFESASRSPVNRRMGPPRKVQSPRRNRRSDLDDSTINGQMDTVDLIIQRSSDLMRGKINPVVPRALYGLKTHDWRDIAKLTLDPITENQPAATIQDPYLKAIANLNQNPIKRSPEVSQSLAEPKSENVKTEKARPQAQSHSARRVSHDAKNIELRPKLTISIPEQISEQIVTGTQEPVWKKTLPPPMVSNWPPFQPLDPFYLLRPSVPYSGYPPAWNNLVPPPMGLLYPCPPTPAFPCPTPAYPIFPQNQVLDFTGHYQADERYIPYPAPTDTVFPQNQVLDLAGQYQTYEQYFPYPLSPAAPTFQGSHIPSFVKQSEDDEREAYALEPSWASSLINTFSAKYPMTGSVRRHPVAPPGLEPKIPAVRTPVSPNLARPLHPRRMTRSNEHAAVIQQRLEFLLYQKKEKAALKKLEDPEKKEA
jgi:hypothetical protein